MKKAFCENRLDDGVVHSQYSGLKGLSSADLCKHYVLSLDMNFKAACLDLVDWGAVSVPWCPILKFVGTSS